MSARTVRLPHGYVLRVTDAGEYEMTTPDGETLFAGDDYRCGSHDCTSDAGIACLLGFLTLKPGDTDADYFEDYTPAQFEFTRSGACDEMGMMVYDIENAHQLVDEHDDFVKPTFRDITGTPLDTLPYDPRVLGEALADWVGGQWDGVYALSCCLPMGKMPDRDSVERALRNLRRDYAALKGRKDMRKERKDLKGLIAQVEMLLALYPAESDQ